MLRFSYWLDGVGFITRGEVRKMMGLPHYNFHGFHRRKGICQAFAFVFQDGKTHILEIRDFKEALGSKVLRQTKKASGLCDAKDGQATS
jgi:hypothetical protein